MLIGLSNVSNLLQNSQFPVFSLFWWPFCYHSKSKVKLIPDIYTCAIVLMNLFEENAEKHFLFF